MDLTDLDKQIAEALAKAKAAKLILDDVTDENITVKEGAELMEELDD